MAKFDDIDGGTLNIGQLLGDITINTFDRLVRGFVFELLSINANDFNKMNHDFMRFHMFRNLYEKEVTLKMLGENAYRDGNSDVTATPALDPTYAKGNNYMEFVSNTREAEKNGVLTTRVQKAGDENSNKYLDMDTGDSQVEFTGRPIDRNSILYKTKKLMRQQKLKTIISAFHTDKVVEYNGQIGTKQYGESHGRNLLTKETALGQEPYKIGSYDDPYCRVWTHHYKYDKLSKTIRAESENLTHWSNFEWNDNDKGHKKDSSKYGDGENYDYAWKGKHNQDRIKAHSVLDKKTGLVKITPQYGDKEETNRHTKDCMFSIENLAWKDYDPYAFEQALSWEQRGPLGGRIMWFPPYGIEVTETASAKWQTNEFIGRGEPVYTYVNSERSGNLSFIMLTDHPSSIDYASWWDNNNLTENTIEDAGNCENDYLRYFAGCNDDDTEGKTGGLIIKPTPMTDEYLQDNSAPLIKKEKYPEPTPEPVPPSQLPSDDKNPIIIEFYMFFPNNYSGIHDAPTTPGADVNAIAYLLGGRDGQKYFTKQKKDDYGQQDKLLSLDSNFDYDAQPGNGNDCYYGYEMGKGGVTTTDCVTNQYGFYIQGGDSDSTKEGGFIVVKKKKWEYRIDHDVPYTGGNDDPENTINQKNYLATWDNLKDTGTNKFNLIIDNQRFTKQNELATLYSFAEVAAALYSPTIMNKESLYNYLIKCLNEVGADITRVDKLIEIFNSEDLTLETIETYGTASSQDGGSDLGKTRNETLAKNRANTILNWLHTITTEKQDWSKIENSCEGGNPVLPTPESAGQFINDPDAKFQRSAHCILTFTSGKTQQTTVVPGSDNGSIDETEVEEVNRDIVGFTYLRSEMRVDGTVWDYYKKDGSITYYDQKADGQDNYENIETNDIVVTEQDVIDIFDNVQPKQTQIIRNSVKYRGLYNIHGFYIDTFDYSKNDDPDIVDFNYSVDDTYETGTYIYDDLNLDLYSVEVTFTTQDVVLKTPDEIWLEYGIFCKKVTGLMHKYNEDDYVLVKGNNNEDIFYKCLVNYDEAYTKYTFEDNDWTKLTLSNIEDALAPSYTHCTVTGNYSYVVKDVIMEDDGVFKVCTGVGESPYPYYNREYWEEIEYSEFVPCEGAFTYNLDDYVTYANDLYICVDTHYYSDDFSLLNWEMVMVTIFNPDSVEPYSVGKVVVQELHDTVYYKAIKNVYTSVCKCNWSYDLTNAISKLVKSSDNPLGYFDGNYAYGVGDYCRRKGDNEQVSDFYYESRVDFNTKPIQTDMPFNEALSHGYWARTSDAEMNSYEYTWDLVALVNKAAAVLCFTVDEMVYRITADAPNNFNKDDESFNCIWKYGQTNNLVTSSEVYRGRNLYNYAETLEPNSRPDSGIDSPPIKFTEDENRYIELIVDAESPEGPASEKEQRMIQLRTYVILYRILDGINKIEDDIGVRKVCEAPSESDNEMDEKTIRLDESETEGCSNIWVDRGDGLLIQECNIKNLHNPYDLLSAREDQREGYNKLRYDQEYHFFKHFSIEHPLLFQKLQEKIKYFNPAFHSMTPEGFNARCTFLQQCTRQGNTKTMSDKDGKTANNLAFGRAPYCVLRLGDFYNQMIIIDNITFDYNISEGLQWDLNPEGNGVQPMLCKVNISFKFIGGGDITGPVQRLQNAQSFNYYANTSFYDNRADRVEYQPTNWKTMGGAGNDKIDTEKSYAYLTQRYQENIEQNIFTPVQ